MKTPLPVARAAALLAPAGVWAALGLGGCQPAPPMTHTDYLARAKKLVVEIPPQQAAEELRDNGELFLLDVSLWVEYQKAHIAGAVLIPRGYLEFKIARNDLFPPINRGRVPRKDQRILVYCQVGARAALAAATLNEMGYTNVRSLQGGLAAWRQAGLPVEKGAAPAP